MPALKTYATKEQILKGLNPEQKKAVTHGDGPILVVAGAGTGKTTVIIRRIAHLIAAKKAKPSEILALTFTDKAAEEMEARVDRLVPYGFIDVLISTFHAFGDRVLREHAIDLGLRPDYQVLSRAEQVVFFREHIFEFPLKYYKSLSDPTRHVEALISLISRAQDEDLSPAEYLKGVKDKQQVEAARIYKKYQELKAKKGFVDFADQVSLVLKLFRKNPAILKKFQQRFKYILVDEFQDTNYAQFALLKLLAGKKANLMVVGDDDQSIYRFRGAAISNILGFSKQYKKSKTIVLTKNYRSTQIILDTARRLIKHNDPDRLEVIEKIDKKLKAIKKGKEKKSQHFHFDCVFAEADWVAQAIKQRFDKGEKLCDFAILVRANADADIFKQALNSAGLASQSSGKSGLYSYPEVQLAVSFLKSIGELTDSAALYQLAASSIYQLDPLDLQKMNAFAKRRNYTLHHVMAHLEDGGEEFEVLNDISKESRVTMRKIIDDIKYYLGFAKQKTTGEVLYQFMKRSGYLSKLTKEDSLQNENRLMNLAKFFNTVKQFNAVAELDRVFEFINYLNVLREAGDNPETVANDPDLDAVNILTVHKAKGLEFKVVFMVALAAEKFPVRRKSDPIELPLELYKEKVPQGDFHLQEERRLFYVGMTRAQEELYLTSAADYGGKRVRKVSQFVLEALDQVRADIGLIKSTPKGQIELFAPAEIVLPGIKKIKNDEPLYLSFYQIDDYLTCPLKYKYVHILRVPMLPNHMILYGSALHKAAQAYNLAKLNKQKFTERDLLSVLENNWSAEGFISREHEEQRLAAAKKALNLFYRKEKKSKRKIKFAEESFSIAKENVIIRGRFDRVDEQQGNIHIVDYKTSEIKEQPGAEKRAKQSLQLSIYALAWLEKYGKLPYRLELYFFEKGIVAGVEKNKADVAKTWSKINGVEQGIRKANFKPKPNARVCGYCPYSEICPASAV
ncbi:MAG: ATP-dependent helicase [Candidatus Margulisbacteria bacterium]|nr:ATP-dependent helicase [Candidatus Margulisiibacteriota bacterium]